MCVHGCTTVHVWRLEDSFGEPALSPLLPCLDRVSYVFSAVYSRVVTRELPSVSLFLFLSLELTRCSMWVLGIELR